MAWKHKIHKVTAFEKTAPFTLKVAFDDATEQVINFLPVLNGPVFGVLSDEAVFDSVHIDPDVHTLVWENGADFDPATLHDWSQAYAVLPAADMKAAEEPEPSYNI
jgi:hypothetical protein